MFRSLPAPETHEDIFVSRYDRMLGWARQMVGGDRNAAEDLVHDAFVNFTVTRPEGVANIDAYLFTALRNLHLANVRRGARRRDRQMSLVEYESAAEAVQALTPTRAHEELAAICHYACVRRLSSKAGSVLILRFFHGYAPAEIGRVLRMSPDAADNLLRLGRREARVWLQDPRRLSFPRMTETPRRGIGFGDPSSPLFDLQAAIFNANETPCPPPPELRDSYSPPLEPIECAPLAHLVTCRRCLDLVNDTLGLPRLAARHADDGTTQGKRPPRGPGAGADAGRASASRRAQQVLRRRPAELRISANGQVIGGQRVSGEDVSLHVVAQSAERLGFVEVLDEEDERLLLVNVEPPPEGAVEQRTHVALSEGRHLVVGINFSGAWPTVTVTYRDAAAAAAVDAVRLADSTPAREALESSEWSARCDASSERVAIPRAASAAGGLGGTPRKAPPLSDGAPRKPFLAFLAWLRFWSFVPRPVLVSFAVVLVTIVAIVGPSQSWAAVVQASQAIAGWLSGLVTQHRGDRSGPLRPATAPSAHLTDIALPAPPVTPTREPVSRRLSEAAVLGLEVEILQRLDAIDALYGEDLRLTRRAGAIVRLEGPIVRLEGIVDRPERRRELFGALGALVSVPQFEIDVRVAAERRPRHAATAVVHAVAVTVEHSPINERLRHLVALRGVPPGQPAADAARGIAVRVLDASQRALHHAWAFTRLERQIAVDRLRSGNADAYRTWRALVDRHVSGVLDESATVRETLLEYGLLPAAGTVAGDAMPPRGDASINAGEPLTALVAKQDQSIRTLFAVAPDGAPIDVERTLRALADEIQASRDLAGRLLAR